MTSEYSEHCVKSSVIQDFSELQIIWSLSLWIVVKGLQDGSSLAGVLLITLLHQHDEEEEDRVGEKT